MQQQFTDANLPAVYELIQKLVFGSTNGSGDGNKELEDQFFQWSAIPGFCTLLLVCLNEDSIRFIFLIA